MYCSNIEYYRTCSLHCKINRIYISLFFSMKNYSRLIHLCAGQAFLPIHSSLCMVRLRLVCAALPLILEVAQILTYSSSETSDDNPSSSTSSVEIAGIIIGVIVALIVICCCCYCCKHVCSSSWAPSGHFEDRKIRVWVTD